jgi:glycosyltransferase involved in cell wall biosynthesis
MPVHWSYASGGAELQVKKIIDHIINNELKYEIFFLCKYTKQSKYRTIKIININNNRKFLKKEFIVDYFELKSHLNTIKPDIVYQRVGNAYTGFIAHFCKKFKCKGISHISSDSDLVHFGFKSRKRLVVDFLNNEVIKYGLRNISEVICQTQYQSTIVNIKLNKSANVIKNFHSTPELCIKDTNKVKILWIANFKPLKNPGLFMKLSEHFMQFENVEFIMIGRPAKDYFDKNEIRNKRLKIVGEISNKEVNEYLSQGHILVNTSSYEGFPNTFIQAWMNSVPVVSLFVDPDDVIKKNKIGLHSVTFNQLVKDVEKLILNNGFRNDMGNKARTYAISNHSLDNIKQIISIFES